MRVRLLAIAVSVAAAIFILVPSVWPDSGVSEMHDYRLHLSPELSGGMDIQMLMDTDAAIRAAVLRDAHDLAMRSDRREYGLDIRAEPALSGFTVASPRPLEVIEDIVSGQFHTWYEHKSSNGHDHLFALTEARRAEIRRDSSRAAVEVLRQRVAEVPDGCRHEDARVLYEGGEEAHVVITGVCRPEPSE